MLSTAVPADTTVIAKPSSKQHGDAKDDDRRRDPQTRLAAVEADQRGGPYDRGVRDRGRQSEQHGLKAAIVL
jgi:hypothetical protein